MDYYWELIQFDGTRLEIPPSMVDIIKKRMTDGQPINTRNMTIPVNQIKFFRITDKVFTDQVLLGEVAQAFNEPVLTEEGDIVCRWVKKTVTQTSWDKYYAPHGYKKLADINGMITVALRLPLHQINQLATPYCTEEEIKLLEKR